MMELTIRAAVTHLTKHPPPYSDTAIADRATKILRTWGINCARDRVSRPLVSMIRRGQARRAAGVKGRAIWEAMAALKLIPGVPREALMYHAPTANREASGSYYWRQKYLAIEARLRGGELVEEVKEVPMLTVAMLKYFGFERNPLFDEIRGLKDVWWGRQHQEAKAILIDAAEGGRFIRLAGRRGAGKSLVAQAVLEELKRRDDLIIVEPSAVVTGVLSELHLISAIIQAIRRRVDGRDELYSEPQIPTRRALAMRYYLQQQRKAGRKVVVWIDEAHELPATTFLALKRFLDEVEGLGRRLLSVILIGQNPEAAHNPRARDLSEVTLRLETYRLQPMHDEIPDYLRWKIQRAGGSVGDVITPAALKAVAARCPYPLDANVALAQLLLEGYAEKIRPIGRELVQETESAEPERAEAV